MAAHRPFPAISTDRLLLRPARLADLDALIERRNNTKVAELQAWPLPYPADRAKALLEAVTATDGPEVDEWWLITVADLEDTEVIGDVVMHLTWGGRCAEVGYSLHPNHWRKGYAREAGGALVAWIFADPAVTRVHGMLHPDNHGSARVLEHLGMSFEGHTRNSFWVSDENSDDWIYGMTRAEWEAWRDRPQDPPAKVQLVEITAKTARDVGRLVTHKSQERFVTPVLGSFRDALFPEYHHEDQIVPWLRAVEADGELVGFVMLSEETEKEKPCLWRLLIDRHHQRRGIGRAVVEQVIEKVRADGSDALDVYFVEGIGSPRQFYESFGFAPTGEILDGETEARLPLA